MFCKYCGAKIDDDSLFCVKCGTQISLQKEIIADENQDIEKKEDNTDVPEQKDAMENVDSIVVSSEDNLDEFPEKAENQKKSKRLLFIIGGCILVIAAALIIYFTVIKKESLKLPYGLEPGMSLSQAHQKMVDAGFSFWRNGNNVGEAEYFYGSYLGLNTTYTIMEVRSEGRIQVTHIFSESGRGSYSKDNKGSKYQKIYDDFVKKYGKPEEEDWFPDYSWNNGKYHIEMWYSGDGSSFYVYFIYDPDD